MSSDSIATSTVTLNTGAKIPVIALGTWESSPEDAYNAVISALKIGYRHVDTAKFYHNEGPIGKAIRDSGVPREDIFLTTKLWLSDFHDPVAAIDNSLKTLGLDYVDLYLMHWPFALKSDNKTLDTSIDFIQAYEKMQSIPTEKARAIGVSNFDIENLTKLLNAPTVKTIPATNQVELHVKLPQQKLVDFCHSKNIIPEAYSPLGRGDLDNETLKKIGEKHGVSPATVAISWGIQRKCVVLPKSVKAERIKSNLEYVDLDQQDMDDILSISKSGVNRHCDQSKDVGLNCFHDNADSK